MDSTKGCIREWVIWALSQLEMGRQTHEVVAPYKRRAWEECISRTTGDTLTHLSHSNLGFRNSRAPPPPWPYLDLLAHLHLADCRSRTCGLLKGVATARLGLIVREICEEETRFTNSRSANVTMCLLVSMWSITATCSWLYAVDFFYFALV